MQLLGAHGHNRDKRNYLLTLLPSLLGANSCHKHMYMDQLSSFAQPLRRRSSFAHDGAEDQGGRAISTLEEGGTGCDLSSWKEAGTTQHSKAWQGVTRKGEGQGVPRATGTT